MPTREQIAIAKRINKRVKGLRRQGGDEALLGGMHGLMLEFEPLLHAQPGTLDELCGQFTDFRYFAQFLEQFAGAMQAGTFDDLSDEASDGPAGPIDDHEPIDIPDTIFNNLMIWMSQEGDWPDQLQSVIFEHFNAYCEACDIDDFSQIADRVGQHAFSVFWGWAFEDFLSRETDDGNVIGTYLKRRGWREETVNKAYMQAVRNSVLSLYEVSDIQPGKSFLARDLIRGGDPVRVVERTATQTFLPWEQVATRLVEMRGRRMIAGPIMSFDHDLSDDLIDQIQDLASNLTNTAQDIGPEAGIDGDLSHQELSALALQASLQISAPLFTNLWLLRFVELEQNSAQPEIFNSDGDPIEFIIMHVQLKTRVTQKQIKALMDDAPDMVPADSKCWNWVEREPQLPSRQKPKGQTFVSRMEDGSIALGLLTLQGRKLVIEVNSRSRAERLQERLKVIAGDFLGKAVLSHQTVERALAEHREAKEPGDAPTTDIPPEVQEEVLRNMLDANYLQALDQPIEMLDDQTPRQAVHTKAGRAKTASWLKHLEMMTARQVRTNAMESYDFTWMWRELGIEELRR